LIDEFEISIAPTIDKR